MNVETYNSEAANEYTLLDKTFNQVIGAFKGHTVMQLSPELNYLLEKINIDPLYAIINLGFVKQAGDRLAFSFKHFTIKHQPYGIAQKLERTTSTIFSCVGMAENENRYQLKEIKGPIRTSIKLFPPINDDRKVIFVEALIGILFLMRDYKEDKGCITDRLELYIKAILYRFPSEQRDLRSLILNSPFCSTEENSERIKELLQDPTIKKILQHATSEANKISSPEELRAPKPSFKPTSPTIKNEKYYTLKKALEDRLEKYLWDDVTINSIANGFRKDNKQAILAFLNQSPEYFEKIRNELIELDQEL